MTVGPRGPEDGDASAHPAAAAPTEQTVEQVVRSQLAKALGGVRGMIEGAVPTIGFTLVFVVTRELRTALVVGLVAAGVLLVARLAQRQTVQFVLNAFLGIAIGAFIAARTGEARDYFLPGILINAGYAVVMIGSIVARWPVVGFLIGSVTGDPTAWHKDRQIVRLCTTLTWVLVLPNLVRVAVQLPLFLLAGDDEGSWAFAALGASKIALGWPLQVAALALMVYLLGRNRTPVAEVSRPAGPAGP